MNYYKQTCWPRAVQVFLFLSLTLFYACGGGEQAQEKSSQVNSTSSYLGILLLDSLEGVELPFDFVQVVQNSTVTSWIIRNGLEEIEVKDISKRGDSIVIQMPVFQSYFVLSESDGYYEGYFKDPSRGDYRVPFKAFPWEGPRFRSELGSSNPDFDGSWKVTFSPKLENQSLAIGRFQQDSSGMTGTFLTETGDYRFLDGQIIERTMYLSAFDGSHLFLFTAQYAPDDKLYGLFYSGNHWKEKWRGERDDSFVLREMDNISKASDGAFSLVISDSAADPFDFSDYRKENKLYLLQIMGSWCPNCMDESKYFQDLNQRYSDRGLEILAFAYERHRDPENAREAIDKMKADLGITYPVFFAGKASKSLANEHFSQLDTVISFPTSILVNQNGEVVKVHTGFNGPGTGKAYEEYTKSFEKLLNSAMEELGAL
jgi:thiol-disulfide isomerase/thioredoxin